MNLNLGNYFDNNILIVIGIAIVAGLLLSRLVKLVNLPNVTGYLIAGLIIGPYCLGVFQSGTLEAVTSITSVALGFIAFSIGGEFKLSSLRRVGGKAVVITLFQALAAVLLVDVALIAFGICDTPTALLLGAIATATAPAATLMVVRQYRAQGPMTNTLLSVVAMDDAVGLAVFSISMSIAQTMISGVEPSVQSMVLEPLFEIVCSLALGFGLGMVLAFVTRFFKSAANRLTLSIAVVIIGVALADVLGLSSLLLCMSIGAAFVNFRKDTDAILESVDKWTSPLFLLFFVISGAELDLQVLTTVGIIGIVYLIMRSLGKYFGTVAGALAVKSDKNIRWYLGLTLLPQAGVAIGMSQVIMNQLPDWGGSAQIRAVVLTATLVYELVGPVITRIALTKAGEIYIPENEKKSRKLKNT